jgi:PilZ domain
VDETHCLLRCVGGIVGEIPVERRKIEPAEAEIFLEQRKHKRYAVDGMAEVLVADGTMLFRGRVLDVSVTGCYIETHARLRLLPGTLVEMVFRVDGRVFRPLATSRMVRPGEGAGFLFTKPGARMQMELEALITALEGQDPGLYLCGQSDN